jgi:hypothetical protein
MFVVFDCHISSYVWSLIVRLAHMSGIIMYAHMALGADSFGLVTLNVKLDFFSRFIRPHVWSYSESDYV